jgi:rhomboid protease GluP
MNEIATPVVATEPAKSRPQPWLTIGLLGAFLIVAVAMWMCGVSPWIGRSDALVRWGANWGPYTLGEHQYWRLLTCAFVHIGAWHLLLNGSALWAIGPTLERRLGRGRFALLFVLSAATGSTVSLLWRPHGLSVGSSGAIFGLFAAAAVIRLRDPSGTATWPRAARRAGRTCAIFLLVYLLIPGIDNAAHVGGAVAGAVLAMLLEQRVRYRSLALAVAGVASLIAATKIRFEATVETRGHRLKIAASAAHARGEYARAAELAEQSLALISTDAEPHLIRGDAYMRLNQLDRAQEAFRAARRVAPADVRPSAYLCTLRTQNRERELLPECDRALASDVGAARPYVMASRGAMKIQLHEIEPGLADVDAAIAAGLDNSDVRLLRGFAELRLGRRDEATRDLARAKELATDESVALPLCGDQLQLQHFDEAARECDRAIRYGQRVPLARSMRAAVRFLSGKRAEAQTELEQLSRDFPQNGDVWAAKAWISRLAGAPVRAIEEATRAIALKSQLGPSLSNRCWARVDIGQLALAKRDCQQSYELNPEALDDLAMTHYIDGNRAEAARVWEGYLRRFPQDERFLQPYLDRARHAAPGKRP